MTEIRGRSWLLIAAYFFGNVSSQTLHVHQVAYLVDHGVAAIVAASVVGVVGLSSYAVAFTDHGHGRRGGGRGGMARLASAKKRGSKHG